MPPALGIARKLQARGHQVRFLGHAIQEEPLAAPGMEVIAPQHRRHFSALAAQTPSR